MPLVKAIWIPIFVMLLTACASPGDNPDRLKRHELEKYREGVQAAKADLRRGLLAYEDIQCEEEEGTRILWCYSKLLKEKYAIEYRIISPSLVPGVIGRMKRLILADIGTGILLKMPHLCLGWFW